MTTKESKVQAVEVSYDKLQRALSRLGIVYNIPNLSHAMQAVQDAIGDYADAEIELHSHEEKDSGGTLPPIEDAHMLHAHVIMFPWLQ